MEREFWLVEPQVYSGVVVVVVVKIEIRVTKTNHLKNTGKYSLFKNSTTTSTVSDNFQRSPWGLNTYSILRISHLSQYGLHTTKSWRKRNIL